MEFYRVTIWGSHKWIWATHSIFEGLRSPIPEYPFLLQQFALPERKTAPKRVGPEAFHHSGQNMKHRPFESIPVSRQGGCMCRALWLAGAPLPRTALYASHSFVAQDCGSGCRCYLHVLAYFFLRMLRCSYRLWVLLSYSQCSS